MLMSRSKCGTTFLSKNMANIDLKTFKESNLGIFITIINVYHHGNHGNVPQSPGNGVELEAHTSAHLVLHVLAQRLNHGQNLLLYPGQYVRHM